MKFNICFIFLVLLINISSAQDRLFSYIGKYSSENELKVIADSLKKPILVTGDKVYAIGSDCITRLFDGDSNDRNKDGSENDRDNDGNKNNRKNGGDDNDRDKGGDEDVRNAAGAVANGPRCSTTKSGKILLYTRQDINSKNASVYYKEKFFNNKYFTLSELGLEANSPAWNGKLTKITTIDYALKSFKKNKYVNYDVLIKNPNYPKPYYGKIAFVNTNKSNENAAVSRFREISIDQSYFADATRGRTAILYEYFQANGFSVSGTAFRAKIPTWILIMSDEPF